MIAEKPAQSPKGLSADKASHASAKIGDEG
jgi:hypothetical protein